MYLRPCEAANERCFLRKQLTELTEKRTFFPESSIIDVRQDPKYASVCSQKFQTTLINPFLTNYPLSYPLKTSENQMFLMCSGGIEVNH